MTYIAHLEVFKFFTDVMKFTSARARLLLRRSLYDDSDGNFFS